MVASGVGFWIESKQVRSINVTETSQKFIRFNYVITLSSMVQRINSKLLKSCFIWQVCQSRYKFSSSPLYPFQGINILCQVWAPKLDTILINSLGLVLHMSYIRRSLEILTIVLLSIPKFFVAQATALSQ